MSFVGLFCLSAMTLIITYLVRKGIPTIFVLLLMLIVVAVFDAAYIVLAHTSPGHIALHMWSLVFAAGILSAIGNLAIYRATAISPNPGLVLTIFGLQAGIVSVGAVWIFKDRLNILQVLGIMLGIIAIMVISLGSRLNKNSTVVEYENSNNTTIKK